MLREMIENNIILQKEVKNWEEAIKIAANPLLENGNIENRYIDAMINSVKENGPYIVIMPGFAMPHSKPENGVIKTGVSLLKLEKEVAFDDESKASTFVVLAANDEDKHLELISELTNILMEEEKLNTLLQSNSKEELLQCL